MQNVGFPKNLLAPKVFIFFYLFFVNLEPLHECYPVPCRQKTGPGALRTYRARLDQAIETFLERPGL